MDREEYFMELYGTLPRAGPGDSNSTRRAFEQLKLVDEPKILDVGCGPGVQTVDLLKMTKGTVVALDFYQIMLDRTKALAEKEGVADRLVTTQGDMTDMDWKLESFDVVWSEGAIYIIGFRRGLEVFKSFLRPGGYLVASEAVWLKPDPPHEVKVFWDEYPEIDFADEKLKIAEDLGYHYVDHFILPHSSWTTPYYNHLVIKVEEKEEEWKGIPEAEDVLVEARNELAVFEKYAEYYSYAFFILRK